MKTKIYLWCVPLNAGSGIVRGSTLGGDVMGYAITEDGRGLASHWSSNVDYSKHDMGLTSDWKHEGYAKACPEGYELEWVNDVDAHPGLLRALEINHANQRGTEENG